MVIKLSTFFIKLNLNLKIWTFILPIILFLSNQFFYITTLLVCVLIGGILTVVERKFLAVLQRRIGPFMVGYRGRTQFIADAIKVLIKEPIFVKNTKKTQLIAMPIIFLIINMAGMLILNWGGDTYGVSTFYDVPTMLLVFSLSNLIAIITGFSLKNKYTSLSAERAINLSVTNEIALGLLLSLVACIYGSFSFSVLNKSGYLFNPFFVFIPAIVGITSIALLDIGKAPFDLVEAETELVMGFHSDYSGFMFVLFLLGEYVHMALMAYFVDCIFAI